MTPRRERIAWLLFVAVIALTALRLPGGVTPTDKDLAFVHSLVEIKQRIDREYVRPIDEQTLREAAIAGMLQALDQHSLYVPPRAREAFDAQIEGTFQGVGILIQPYQPPTEGREDSGGLIVVRPLPGSPAQQAGILAGDRIIGVDGQNITNLGQEDVISRITGPSGTEVTLTVERGEDGKRLDLTMTRASVASPVLDGYRLDPDGSPTFWVEDVPDVKLAFISIDGFTRGSSEALRMKIEELLSQGMQGLILDLRNNPGGLLNEAVAMADLFVEAGPIVTVSGEHVPERTFMAERSGTLQNLPLVVMVNELSASASEVLAGALQDYDRATIVGTRSFGKGSVQDVIELSNTGELKLTTAYYYLPSGRSVDREAGEEEWGVTPDVVVPVDYDDPAQVRDDRRPLFPRQVDVAIDVLLGLVATTEQGPAQARPAAATREAA